MRNGWLLVLVALIAGGVLFARRVANLPADPSDTAEIAVVIPEGASSRKIAALLAEAGLLRSPRGFLLRVFLSGARGDLQAGTYRFTKAESGGTILARLRGGDVLPRDVAVTFPEGFTLAEIADRLARNGVVSRESFVAAARAERFRDSFPFLSHVPDGSLEGFLFPDTYRFFRDADADDVVRRFLMRFEEQFETAVKDAGGHGDRSVHDIVTMASIIEREVVAAEDRRIVSGILWSRLDRGVALEADATVRFVLDDWEKILTAEDLRADSPYNTRRYAGLPPGPIGNPGLESLHAALQPRDSEFFYYLSAKDDGRTIFSRTLEEHNAAIREHLR